MSTINDQKRMFFEAQRENAQKNISKHKDRENTAYFYVCNGYDLSSAWEKLEQIAEHGERKGKERLFPSKSAFSTYFLAAKEEYEKNESIIAQKEKK